MIAPPAYRQGMSQASPTSSRLRPTPGTKTRCGRSRGGTSLLHLMDRLGLARPRPCPRHEPIEAIVGVVGSLLLGIEDREAELVGQRRPPGPVIVAEPHSACSHGARRPGRRRPGARPAHSSTCADYRDWAEILPSASRFWIRTGLRQALRVRRRGDHLFPSRLYEARSAVVFPRLRMDNLLVLRQLKAFEIIYVAALQHFILRCKIGFEGVCATFVGSRPKILRL